MKFRRLHLLLVIAAVSAALWALWATKTSADARAQAFRDAYIGQVTAALERTYKRDSGSGIPYLYLYDGGGAAVTCDFHEDNTGVRCSVRRAPANVRAVLTRKGFTPSHAGSDEFLLNLPIAGKKTLQDLAETLLIVLHDGFGLQPGHVVMLAPRAPDETSYRVLPEGSVFHLARTDPEKALDSILHTTAHAGLQKAQAAILQHPGYDASFRERISGFLTKSLLNVWAETGKEDVKNCRVRKNADGSCGLDFNVILCGQDFPDTFVYQTVSADDNESVIAYAFPEYLAHGGVFIKPTYRMVKQGKRWKLDGVHCDQGKRQNFNMPEDGFLSASQAAAD